VQALNAYYAGNVQFGRDQYIEDGDTLWYSQSGIKLMVRVCADLKNLVQTSRLGREDLKLYCEAALLGLKNYPVYYEKVAKRVPVMIGINLPAFRLLDYLSAEFEYYGSGWKNNPGEKASAVPYESFVPAGEFAPYYVEVNVSNPDAGEKGERDNIKWALEAKRSFGARMAVKARVASDHLRTPGDRYLDPVERLHGPDEFYWQIGFQVIF
jgi:hypothetical protein